MSTDYLLWLWSLTAQAASATMIVGFFAALRRSFPTAEVRVWTPVLVLGSEQHVVILLEQPFSSFLPLPFTDISS